MNRRDFIALLGGAAAWPLAARAQQRERVRRVGVLLNLSENDVEAQRLVKAFGEGLAQRYRLPAMYYFPFFARDGGLISYGPDEADMFRQAAGYVDRILKGAKASDLPVQQPTKYELVINLKTAKTLGLTIPE